MEETKIFSDIDASNFEPKYKAVCSGDARTGIRLEQTFWLVLREIADDSNSSMCSLVKEAQSIETGQSNLTSALRVLALDWIKNRLVLLSSATSDQMVRNILNACPSPGLALSVNKKLHSFNKPFLRYITDNFKLQDQNMLPTRLGLVLDQPIEDVIERLVENGNQPMKMGIAIGMDERRIRSQMNVLLAPSFRHDVIIGYIFQ